MRRREFLGGLGAAAAGWPFASAREAGGQAHAAIGLALRGVKRLKRRSAFEGGVDVTN